MNTVSYGGEQSNDFSAASKRFCSSKAAPVRLKGMARKLTYVGGLFSQKNKDTDYEDSNDKMMSVIALQQLNGEWEVSGQLLMLLGVPKEEFDKQKLSEVPSVMCTVIVLSWLKKEFSHRHEEWQIIETKALAWLTSQNLPMSVEDIIQQTTQSLWSK